MKRRTAPVPGYCLNPSCTWRSRSVYSWLGHARAVLHTRRWNHFAIGGKR